MDRVYVDVRVECRSGFRRDLYIDRHGFQGQVDTRTSAGIGEQQKVSKGTTEEWNNTAHHRLALLHILLSEKKLSIQIRQVDSVQVQESDMSKS